MKKNTNKPSHNDIFKILVSTDNHLGHKEQHPIRSQDSFDALEEVLKSAIENDVDFLLLGGDLFHEINPSQECLYKCINLLQQYIYGDKTPSFQVISDYKPNFDNENIKIHLPIFIIHGNHDYPATNGGHISVLDLLHASQLLNYYGKVDEFNKAIVKPLLLQKGTTKIALYGLGHIKDTKLHYMLEKDKIEFQKPPGTDYFNILVVHQNRFKGIKAGAPYKNCIHPAMLPNFMNLVIWGHEHESMTEINENEEHNFYIYQPGSSVMTSLITAESKPKQAGYFEIKGDEFTYKPLFLKSQRPLFVNNLELSQLMGNAKSVGNIKKPEGIIDEELDEDALVVQRIEEEITKLLDIYEKAKIETGIKKLPLVRLKIEYSGFDIIRVKALEVKFQGRVANEGEILKFWRKQKAANSTKIKENEKLNEKFEESLKAKISFGVLTSDSNDIIKTIFEDLLQKDQRKAKLLSANTFIDKFLYINQKPTNQTVQNIINNSIEFVDAKMMNDKLIGLNLTTKKFLKSADECLYSNFQNSKQYSQDLTNTLKDYETNIQNLNTYISNGIKEHHDDKNDNLIIGNNMTLEAKYEYRVKTGTGSGASDEVEGDKGKAARRSGAVDGTARGEVKMEIEKKKKKPIVIDEMNIEDMGKGYNKEQKRPRSNIIPRDNKSNAAMSIDDDDEFKEETKRKKANDRFSLPVQQDPSIEEKKALMMKMLSDNKKNKFQYSQPQAQQQQQLLLQPQAQAQAQAQQQTQHKIDLKSTTIIDKSIINTFLIDSEDDSNDDDNNNQRRGKNEQLNYDIIEDEEEERSVNTGLSNKISKIKINSTNKDKLVGNNLSKSANPTPSHITAFNLKKNPYIDDNTDFDDNSNLNNSNSNLFDEEFGKNINANIALTKGKVMAAPNENKKRPINIIDLDEIEAIRKPQIKKAKVNEYSNVKNSIGNVKSKNNTLLDFL